MIEIIPAIDIIGGKCVRLSRGDFATQKTYSEHPVDIAKQFEAIGIKRLHLVDLDGAKQGKIVNVNMLQSIAAQTGLQIDYSGGVKTDDDIKRVFGSGASFVCIGSMAVKQPGTLYEWIEIYGADKLILGADVSDMKIVINGWQEKTNINILDFISGYITRGIDKVLCTDIAKDGMLKGASTALYESIIKAYPGIKLIASGGVSCMDDVIALDKIGCKSVVIGKALYEGNISITELAKYIAK